MFRAKVCPKHVELILEINKTVIVASHWFLYYLTYILDEFQAWTAEGLFCSSVYIPPSRFYISATYDVVSLIILGMFAKLRKATVSYVMSVRLSVRMEQLGSNWTGFHGI